MLQTNLTVTKASKRYKLNTKMLKQHLYYHIIKNFTPLKTKHANVITFTNNHIVSLCKNFKIFNMNDNVYNLFLNGLKIQKNVKHTLFTPTFLLNFISNFCVIFIV